MVNGEIPADPGKGDDTGRDDAQRNQYFSKGGIIMFPAGNIDADNGDIDPVQDDTGYDQKRGHKDVGFGAGEFGYGKQDQRNNYPQQDFHAPEQGRQAWGKGVPEDIAGQYVAGF